MRVCWGQCEGGEGGERKCGLSLFLLPSSGMRCFNVVYASYNSCLPFCVSKYPVRVYTCHPHLQRLAK